jgi:gamma-glutamyltranspeptidase / glutathione hydrolase
MDAGLRSLKRAKLGFPLAALSAIIGVVCGNSTVCADTATAEKSMIATVSPLATEAGLQVFRDGGNALDAAVAAALTLGVVDGYNSGVGGGCLILVRSADGHLTAIDGREMAPQAATKDMFVHEGAPIPEASQTGPLAVAVPGAFAAYQVAVEKCGTKLLAQLLEPGIQAAEEGFVVDSRYARTLREAAADLRRFEGSKAALLHKDGSPYEEGERLHQPDLGRTYRQVAERGIDAFYRGDFAAKVGAWMAANDGILTADDFAKYQAKLREPIITKYRGYQVVGFPPPSSGGVHVAEILNILEQFDLRAIEERDPAEATHLIAEAFKLAFADRAYWLGDADYVPVPTGLIAKGYAKELAARIDPQRAIEVAAPGWPPNWKQDVFGRHTTHIAAADSQGNWVAITTTVNTSFGSKIIVPGTGVLLNNEMDDFAIMPGVPNAFKLVGAENNSIAPGKRPLSSMSPTIVLDAEGKPVMTVGAAGGPKIITQVALAIVRYLDFQQPLADAVAGPRVHHQWRPDTLSYEGGLPAEILDRLRSRGHSMEQLRAVGSTQAIAVNQDGKLVGVAEPRVAGKAAGL